jgi:hypothetical protein
MSLETNVDIPSLLQLNHPLNKTENNWLHRYYSRKKALLGMSGGAGLAWGMPQLKNCDPQKLTCDIGDRSHSGNNITTNQKSTIP